MDCTPKLSHEFDKLAKALASAVSRRDALKWLGTGALGIALSTVGLRKAWAVNPCIGNTLPPGSCPPNLCKNNPGDQCICVWKFKNGVFLTAGKPVCVQNFFCPGPTCNSTGECKANFGLNWRCVDSACCGGHACAPKCGTVPPCCTAQGEAGATAAGA